MVVTYELATSLGAVSREIGRQVGLLIDRRGLVHDVVVGDHDGLLLPDLGRQRAGPHRLRGIRLVHTHLRPSSLSREDLTDLSRLRLDLVAVVEVSPEGRPGLVHMAHLLPPNPAGDLWHVLEPSPAFRVGVDFGGLIRALEAEFARRTPPRDARDEEGAILVHVQVPGDRSAEDSLRELRALADTAGVRVLDTVLQRRPQFDPRYLAGKGKIEEMVLRALQFGANVILFDHDLTPAQARAIGDTTDLKVIDRTQLILDIFAQRAQSNEGKLQVELAQLRYLLPRLVGKHLALTRQAGGIGTRGPGEKQLEVDRRRVRDRIHRLEKEIARISRQRENRRALRRRQEVPVVAIVGYTNAGKSTLLNTLTRSQVHTEDRLFATLDPTTRRLRFPRNREVVLADTVGFIRDLPRDLVNAFRATLEELKEADVLLHLVDITDPDLEERKASVERILEELGLSTVPRIVVLNKVDRIPEGKRSPLVGRVGHLAISALDPSTLEPLLRALEDAIFRHSLSTERPRLLPVPSPTPTCGEPVSA